MELTSEGEAKREWGPLHALRAILASKQIPQKYLVGSDGPFSEWQTGFLTGQDNIFDQLKRIARMMILVKENSAAIVEVLNTAKHAGDGIRIDRLLGELNYVWRSCKWADSLFKEATGEIRKIHSDVGAPDNEERAENGVRELALRLAWYVEKYGIIPDPELVRLSMIAAGFDSSPEADALRNLAAKISANLS